MANPHEFQQKTIDYVIKKLLDQKKARFLVADEVGLGKTIVARMVIERALRQHEFKGLVFYVCSSLDLATQNLKKLKLQVNGRSKHAATRLTTLPLEKAQIKNSTKIVAITPGTSLDMGRNLGKKEERFFINSVFNKSVGAVRIRKIHVAEFFRGQACGGDTSWNDELIGFESQHADALADFFKSDLYRSLKRRMETEVFDLQEEQKQILSMGEETPTILELVIITARSLGVKDEASLRVLRSLRNKLIGKIREMMSQEVIKSSDLKPSLVIFDEFQNFSSILSGDDDKAKMTSRFIEQSEKCLFLSATPYKAPTTDWNLAETSHYDDFLKLLKILGADKNYSENRTHLEWIKEYFEERRNLLSKTDSLSSNSLKDKIRLNKRRLELLLKKYMVRTERGQFTADPSGAVDHSFVPKAWSVADIPAQPSCPTLNPTLEDVDFLKSLHLLRGKNLLTAHKWHIAKEMWKSIPYPLSFMSGYNMMEEINSKKGRAVIADLFTEFGKSKNLLSTNRKTLFSQKLKTCPNPKMRRFIRTLEDEHAGDLLWVIPENTYYATGNQLPSAQKKLIFSNWRAVPQAVSICGSAFVEGRLDPDARSQSMRKLSLSYSVGENYKSKWSHSFVTFHPWSFLSGIGILDLKAKSNSLLELKNSLRLLFKKEGVKEIRSPSIRGRASINLEIIVDFLSMNEPKVLHHTTFNDILKSDLVKRNHEEDNVDITNRTDFQAQMKLLKKSLGSRKRVFPMTSEEINFLVELTIAGPGVVILRSLQGLFNFNLLNAEKIHDKSGKTIEGKNLIKSYSNILWFSHVVLRSYFASTSSALVINSWSKKSMNKSSVGDWQRILRYSVEHHLQQVCDEYSFLLAGDIFEEFKSQSKSSVDYEKTKNVLLQMLSALSVRPGTPHVKTWSNGGVQGSETVRRHYVQAYVDDSGTEEKNGVKKEHLRDAFNSPFWPFVLVTTSVGQEGLDFHRYCREIIHWNLPSSGVAFEQREGRIQRYMCKAVRDSILRSLNWNTTFNKMEIKRHKLNPWEGVMSFARQKVGSEKIELKGLRPYWSYLDKDGEESRIHRILYCHPFSKEALRYERLKESLILYRLALGQPRYTDFLDKLILQLKESKSSEKEVIKIINELNLDLRP